MAILLLTAARDAVGAAMAAAGLAERVEICERADDVPTLLERRWELVAVDADFAGGGGTALELVEWLSRAGHRVVVLSARPTLALTLSALGAGAHDVLPLPPPAERLTQLADDAARSEDASGASPVALAASEWIGSSPTLLASFRSAVRLAAAEVPVLFWGESGTGKELFARVMHDTGPRSAGPLISVNCGAIPDSVLDSELFGHERGAVVGAYGRRIGRIAKADGGTLFLEELTQLTPRLQAKLLGVLRTGEVEALGAESAQAVSVRMIATTERDPAEHAAEGTLLPELYEVFAAHTIAVPPLRERGDADLRSLVEHLVADHARRYNRRIDTIGEDAWEVLLRYRWPGNIRQLRGALERAVLEAEGTTIHALHLPAEIRRSADPLTGVGSLRLDDVERQHTERVLELTEGHLGRAAELLGIHRNTLRRKLQGWGITGT